MRLEHIKAVAFDLDGTLLDSLPDLLAAANAMRTNMGMPALESAHLQQYVGDGISSLVHRAMTNERDVLAPHAEWERGFRFFVQYYLDHLAERTTVYPGVTTGIGLLKALHLPLAIITNKFERLAQPMLQQLGLADDFALIIGGDTLAEKKPSALPLLHTCQVLGVLPTELLMVGDSENDVLAARNAGCPLY